MSPLPSKLRSRLRLPQLSKSNRLARRHKPVSEFILMARAAEAAEQSRRYRFAQHDAA
jgi:hypothetical protein